MFFVGGSGLILCIVILVIAAETGILWPIAVYFITEYICHFYLGWSSNDGKNTACIVTLISTIMLYLCPLLYMLCKDDSNSDNQ